MDTQSLAPLTTEQQDSLLNNAVNAMQTLYRSVAQRKAREMLSTAPLNKIREESSSQ